FLNSFSQASSLLRMLSMIIAFSVADSLLSVPLPKRLDRRYLLWAAEMLSKLMRTCSGVLKRAARRGRLLRPVGCLFTMMPRVVAQDHHELGVSEPARCGRGGRSGCVGGGGAR